MKFANVMKNTRIINIFGSDDNNIIKIKTQYCQIIIIVMNRLLKFKPIIKTPLGTNYDFLLFLLLPRSVPLLKSIL